MTLMQSLIIYLLSPLLGLLFWIFVAYMIFSWLIAFNIVNLRNPAMAQIYGVIRRICDPILDPIRKIIPPIGGLDMAFLVGGFNAFGILRRLTIIEIETRHRVIRFWLCRFLFDGENFPRVIKFRDAVTLRIIDAVAKDASALYAGHSGFEALSGHGAW